MAPSGRDKHRVSFVVHGVLCFSATISSHSRARHNGVIENAFELKADLERKGVQFHTETDTEVIAQLVL